MGTGEVTRQCPAPVMMRCGSRRKHEHERIGIIRQSLSRSLKPMRMKSRGSLDLAVWQIIDGEDRLHPRLFPLAMQGNADLLTRFGNRQLDDLDRHGLDAAVLHEQRFANMVCHRFDQLEMHTFG